MNMNKKRHKIRVTSRIQHNHVLTWSAIMQVGSGEGLIMIVGNDESFCGLKEEEEEEGFWAK